MPRSSGGRRGSSSSGSSSSNTIRRNVATSVALSSASENFERLTGDSRSCQVVFEMYEKCIMTRSSPQYGASACDSYNDMVASCSRFKRDPHRRKWIQSQQEREERIQRKATAAGFATAYDYLEDQHAKDPALCRSRFKLYKECIQKNPGNEAVCDYYRNNCKQFKS